MFASQFDAPALAQTTLPTTHPAKHPNDRNDFRDRDRIYTLDECLKRFELDDRLALCHVWAAAEGELAGFVEQPQYKAVLERATKKEVSTIKLLPEESKSEARYGILAVEHAILRQEPADRPGDRDNASDLLLGEPVWILDASASGSYLVHASDGYLGWVESSVVHTIGAQAMKAALVHNRTADANKRAEAILDHARSLLATPYLWGGRTKSGIDCSGLVQMSFAGVGILLPRDADQQANVGRLVATRWFKDALLPGDLLFFVSEHRGNVHHVAIYMGEGKYIEAAGDDVHISSLNPADSNYDAERAQTFAWARRVIE